MKIDKCAFCYRYHSGHVILGRSESKMVSKILKSKKLTELFDLTVNESSICQNCSYESSRKFVNNETLVLHN